MRFASTLFAAFIALAATALDAASNDSACDIGYRFEAKWYAAQEAVVIVIDDGKDRRIAFLPASDKTVRIPVFSTKADAREQVECRRWLGI